VLIVKHFYTLPAKHVNSGMRKQSTTKTAIISNYNFCLSILLLYPIGSGLGYTFNVIYRKIFGYYSPPAIGSEFYLTHNVILWPAIHLQATAKLKKCTKRKMKSALPMLQPLNSSVLFVSASYEFVKNRYRLSSTFMVILLPHA
jgi:hypothetical protein